MNCTHCFYSIAAEDIYCCNCGNKISAYEIRPQTRDLTLFEGGAFEFTISNKGMNAIEVDGCSDPKFLLGPATVIQNGDDKKFTITYDDYRAGAKGYFHFNLRPDIKGEEQQFDFRIVPPPAISFSVENAIFKEGVFFISETDVSDLTISMKSSEPVTINKQPTLTNEEDYLLELVSLNKKSSNFKFNVAGIQDLKTGNTFLLDAEFYFEGISVKQSFEIQVTAVSSLEFLPNSTTHNATIDKGTFSPTRLDLIEGANHNSELDANYKVKGGRVRILHVNLPTSIKRQSDGEVMTLDQAFVWQVGSITGREYEEGDTLVLELEINPSKLPENIVEGLLDQLIEFKVEIFTMDPNSGFESKSTVPFSFNLLKREEISITIDYGTSNSCISFLPYNSDDNTPQLADLHLHGGRFTEVPSMIKFEHFYDENGTKKDFLCEDIEVGPAAADYINNAEADITTLNSIAWGFKSLLVKPNISLYFTDSDSRTNKYTPIQLVTLYLNKLIHHFESAYPYDVTELHLTYPAAFSMLEKESLLEAACGLSGFSEEKVFLATSEPIALAVNYANEVAHQLEEDEEKTIAIFDCGGGTTDLTLAKISNIEDDEFGGYSVNMSFQASDGLYTKDRNSTIGGNYLSYLIALQYKNNIESEHGVSIPFPENFKLPIELVNEDQNIKFNSSNLFSLAEKRKIAGEVTASSFFFKYKDEQNEIQELNVGELSDEDIEDALREDLTYALSQIHVMNYLASENTILNQVTLSTETSSIDETKTLVVFAKSVFLKVFTYGEGKKIKLVSRVSSIDDIDEVMEHLSKLAEKNKISSVFIDAILLIGFNERDADQKDEIKDTFSKANIQYFKGKIDSLILAGNSSKHHYLQSLSRELIDTTEIIQSVGWSKTGVAIGACQMNQANKEEAAFSIQNNDIIPYSIGYAWKGGFVSLLNQWLDPTSVTVIESRPRKISPRRSDRFISIFENRDISNEFPRLTPHNAKMQPLIAKLEVPEECVGSYICFSLLFNEHKHLAYTIYSSNTANGIFIPVNLTPIPLKGGKE